MALMEIIRTCVRELKSSVQNLEIEFEDDAASPSAALHPSKLELDLKKKTLLLTERQERILFDLSILRDLLRKVEDLDPFSAFVFLKKLRNDKDFVENNSGWLFTQTTSTIFSGLSNLCKTKTSEDDFPKVATPPKWETLKSVLNEIQNENLENEDQILLISPTEDCSRQLVDVMKFGIKKYQLILTRNCLREMGSVITPEADPPSQSLWNPDNITIYNVSVDFESERKEIVSKIQMEQKKDTRKRKLEAPETPGSKQTSLVSFGVVKYKDRKQKVSLDFPYKKQIAPTPQNITFNFIRNNELY
ncbi:hypothetical protein FO519_009736 [Halicephalobus sp. NKZ332]|nr:hypothetical protein FO519_009736 [Halicephalobus sp. NKZ332]